MRNTLLIALAFVLVLSMAACGQKTDNTPSINSTTSTPGGSTSTPEVKPDNEPDYKERFINKVGDVVGFGNFEGEEIQWQALAVDLENNKALLISETILSLEAFCEDSTTGSWEASQIRTWLNEDFHANAFNDNDKAIIVQTEVIATSNTDYPDVPKGNDVTDYVFLLSAQEAEQYFADETARIAQYSGENDSWYLRTIGLNTESTAFVSAQGEINLAGATNDAEYGVRPAIWIDITPEDENMGNGGSSGSIPTETPSSIPSGTSGSNQSGTGLDHKERFVNKVGDVVGFGNFEGEKIQWQALAVDLENNKALLISETILSLETFCEGSITGSWETSLLRTWLNDDFLFNAFSADEKAIIMQTEVAATNNTEYPDVPKGNDVTDYVFLLSAQEAEQYFADETARIAQYNGENESWYLRTVGLNTESTAFVRAQGEINLAGATNDAEYGVRPAIWIDITPED